MRVAYFTAGTTGAGHLVRALAIERGLRRAGLDHRFRVIGPHRPFPAIAIAEHDAVEIDQNAVTDPFEAPETDLARALADFSPDLLLVDMFWAPLMYLLPLTDCQHWLLVRKARDNWLTGDDFVPFDPSLYQRIIEFEPLGHDICTDRLEPIVIANPDECRDHTELRNLVGVAPDRRLAIVAQAGEEGEVDRITADEGNDTAVVRFDLRHQDAPFPLAEWLGGADAIYCGAGYNSYWEAKWLGYFDRTHFTPFERAIDNQAWRVDNCADYRMKENGADQLARWIAAG